MTKILSLQKARDLRDKKSLERIKELLKRINQLQDLTNGRRK